MTLWQRIVHGACHGSEAPSVYIGSPHCPLCLKWMKRRWCDTEFVNPPIPDRSNDWSAVRKGYEPGAPIGRGRTEADAVADLIELESA